MTDTVLKETVMKHLVETFGNVQAERFISLIISEPFDYIKWQEHLYEDMSLEELPCKAMEFVQKKDNK